jgi:hypothetical protein
MNFDLTLNCHKSVKNKYFFAPLERGCRRLSPEAVRSSGAIVASLLMPKSYGGRSTMVRSKKEFECGRESGTKKLISAKNQEKLQYEAT